jgi:hypothetical protein
MIQKHARDLAVGDTFRLGLCVEVIAVAPVAGTKHVKIKTEVEDQGHRSYSDDRFAEGSSTLEFLDTGHVLEFVSPANRKFNVFEDDGDDWDDDADAPTPLTPVTAE